MHLCYILPGGWSYIFNAIIVVAFMIYSFVITGDYFSPSAEYIASSSIIGVAIRDKVSK